MQDSENCMITDMSQGTKKESSDTRFSDKNKMSEMRSLILPACNNQKKKQSCF